MKHQFTLASSVIVLLTMLGVRGALAQEVPDHYDPATTTIAILPVTNDSGEKTPAFKADQIKAATESARKQFEERGFQLVSDAAASDAAAAEKIDLNDEEQRNRATVAKLGAAVKADLAVLVVITKVQRKMQIKFFSQRDEGWAKVSVWLVDVKTQKALLNAVAHESMAGRDVYVRGQSKFSDLISGACASAVRDVLAPVLKPYPAFKQGASHK